MREFYSQFREGLAKGLRPHRRTVRGVEALIECFNVKPTEAGLIPHSVSTSISGTMDWPLPQLFNLEPCCGDDSYIVITDESVIDNDGNTVLSLVSSYTLTVTVLDGDWGDPINGATVEVELLGGGTLSDTTAIDGTIGFTGLENGTYTVNAEAAGYWDCSDDDIATDTVTISGANATLTLYLCQAG